jgi:hypothetical protein
MPNPVYEQDPHSDDEGAEWHSLPHSHHLAAAAAVAAANGHELDEFELNGNHCL